MLPFLRARSAHVLLLVVVSLVFAAAACSHSGKTTSSTSSGTISTGTSTGSSSGGGGMQGFGGGMPTQTLTITPPTATVTINSKAAPATQGFTALLNGTPVTAQLAWTLDTYAEGTISPTGNYTTTGLVGGLVKVSATYNGLTATAALTVKVAIDETVSQGPMDPGPTPADKTALMGVPLPDPGASAMPPNATKILYPYDQTVMPRGLVAPLLQFSPGNIPPIDALVTLSSTYFTWNGFIKVQSSAVPNFFIPQDVWDGALLSTGGQKLTISVTKASGGMAYGPAKTTIIVAPASLKGAVYYQTYQTPGNGLYSVQPGVKQPATLIKPGCIVCHSVSANGTHLAAGTDDPSVAAQSGIYLVGSNGAATQITQSPPGLGGDSRGISEATFTPDGQFVMRSTNNFWGGVNQLAWKIDDVAKTLTPSSVTGLGANVSAYLPSISADGKHYAFTNGAGESPAFGTVGRSVSLMDLAIDPVGNALKFTNRKLLIDNGAAGSVAKFVSFLPDPNYIVLEEGQNFCASYGEMLPTWSTACAGDSFTGSTGRLFMIKVATNEHLELKTVNAGNAASDAQRNYEPFSLPVPEGGYFWVVFTSIREYGNTYQGANVRKQLWVAAISTSPAAGEDPSHPPFYLPNQSDTKNERGFWALEPCKADGSTCDTGDECCDGFCRPSDPTDPMSPKVCKPPSGSCSQISEKCMGDGDCCNTAAGIHCIGGFCTQPSPN